MERSRTAKVVVATAAGAALVALAAGSGFAATAAAPANTAPPTITGSAVEGSVLTGGRGTWSNNPTDYTTDWQRCDRDGGHCSKIAGSGATATYKLVSADIGHRIRFHVGAANADGRTWAESAPTAIVVAAQPVNVTPPTVSGKPVEGATLTGTRGTWTGKPNDFNSWWQRCDRTGGACGNIAGSGGHAHYVLTAADVGATLRYAVGAANAQGRTWAASAPTAQIAAATPPVKNGCPSTSSPDDVTAISAPARLQLDGIEAPSIVTRQTRQLIVRFHVSSTCNGSVRGALVYVSAVPFFQFASPSEVQTGADGWATVTMQRLAGFPVSSRQQLVALFVRARKAGEDPLGGISTRRLFSVPVNLRA